MFGKKSKNLPIYENESHSKANITGNLKNPNHHFSYDSSISSENLMFNKKLTGKFKQNKALSLIYKMNIFSRNRQTVNKIVNYNDSVQLDIPNDESMEENRSVNLSLSPTHKSEFDSRNTSPIYCDQKSEQHCNSKVTRLSTKSISKTDSQKNNPLHTDIYTHDNSIYGCTSESSGFKEQQGAISSSLPFTIPDPTAYRDLDNASPETIELCRHHSCHYCFYVYFPSSTVDDCLLPFRRKYFQDKFSQLKNSQYNNEIKQTKYAQNIFSDRRIHSIEKQSGTQIHLSELYSSIICIKGIPCRRLTIAGPSFVNICYALNLLENLLPNIIKGAIFPYRLPEAIHKITNIQLVKIFLSKCQNHY
ncbi:unnamed protein product [Schistosoma margrebowiei]|uniref:Uncharacterized protein n=1 Tax=Schistosoma margrebowiei TaxID=48269 RepID=A0AA84ZA51_9TREM|nr:unnamed protein product [Schistosoma margrebowiei]